MHKNIQDAIQLLVDAVRANSPEDAVAFSLFVNAGEYDAEFKFRNAEGLIVDGISMRNLGGEFIRKTEEVK